MKRILSLLFIGLLAVALVGCDSNDDDDDDNGGTVATANVRFVHASPDAGAVDILVDGEVVADDVPYSSELANPTVSSYLPVPIGETATITVQTSSGVEVFTVDVDDTIIDDEDADYTVVVAGAAAVDGAPQPVVLDDSGDESPEGDGEIKIRLVHGSALAGPVNVYIAPAGLDDLSGIDPLAADFEYTQILPPITLPDNFLLLTPNPENSVYVTAAGSTTPLIELPVAGLGLEGGEVITGIAVDNPGAEVPAAVQLFLEAEED